MKALSRHYKKVTL